MDRIIRKHATLWGLALLLAILIYAPSFTAPFQFDDHRIIANNILIQNIKDPGRIWRWDPSRFLSHVTFAINYHFHRDAVFGYHVVNFLLHIINTVWVFFIARLLWREYGPEARGRDRVAFWGSWFTCLIFLTHPIQTAAVTYVVQRSVLLAAFFYLAAFWCYVRFCHSGHRGLYVAACAAALIGAFTKPIIVSLPLAIVLYELTRPHPTPALVSRSVKRAGPFFLLIILVPLLLIMWKYKEADLGKYLKVTRETRDISRGDYLLTQINVVRTYARLLLVPVRQNFDYDYPITRTFWNRPTVLSFGLLTVLLILALWLYHKHRLISFGLFWFFITLSLESTIFPISDVIFEHRLYLPMLGFALGVPVAVYRLCGARRAGRWALIGLICVYSFLTFQRNRVWSDRLTFIKDIQAKSSAKARVYNSLGSAYYAHNKLKQAEAAFRKCLALDPHSVIASRARNNLGLIYFDQGQYTKARKEFQAALTLAESQSAIAASYTYNNFGRLYFAQDRFEPALAAYTKAISLNPYLFAAYNNRGALFRKLKRYDRALKDYDRALRLNPRDVDVLSNKGLLFRIQGQYGPALEAYTRAVNVSSQDARVYYDRGLVYKAMGREKEAFEDFTQALNIDGDFKEVYNERGILLSQAGQYAYALADYDQALALDPEFFDAYYNRGILYLKTERYEEAAADCGRALALDPYRTEIYYHRGLAYFSLEAYDRALKDLERVLADKSLDRPVRRQARRLKARITGR
jgi:tetratricopeptide (TPR) repeat protein